MIYPFKLNFLRPTKPLRRLSVLLTVYNNPRASQHKIAEETHLSSAMVNNYIRELKEKGLVRTTGDTNRTQTYHLTSSGRRELTSYLLSYSAEIIQLYGAARTEIRQRLEHMYSKGIRTVVLFGAAETAEVAYATIKDTQIEVVGVVDSDPKKQGSRFNGFMIRSPKELVDMKVDAVVITSYGKQEEIHGLIRKKLGNHAKIIRLSEV